MGSLTTRSAAGSGRGASPLVALVLALLVATVAHAAEPDPGEAVAASGTEHRTVVHAPLPGRVKLRLRWGFVTALHRLDATESCRDLFTALGADGIEVLRRTLYVPARAESHEGICRRAEAFTVVGSSTVWLCPSFGSITTRDAAVVLLHEALHSAGLGERPSDREAPTSREIDEAVESACGF